MADSFELDYTVPEVKGWRIKEISNFNGGINSSLRPKDIEDSEVIQGKNLRIEGDRTFVDYGYKKFTNETIRGVPRAVFQFFKKDGSEFQTLITDATFYLYNSNEWQYISDGVDTVLTSGASLGATALTVDDITGFSDGDYVGLTLDDGTQHKTTINGAPAGSTINIDDALPSAAASGKALVKAVDLNGSADKGVSIDVVPSADSMIFTNGVDKPKIYDGATCEDLGGLPPGFTSAEVVFQYGDYTWLFNTVESGVAYPQRARNSNTGDPEDWTTQNAGLYDLTSREDHIVTVGRLGDKMIVYKERSANRFTFVGTDDILFDYEEVFSGEGPVSVDALEDMGDYHVFFGAANIYRYDGDFTYEPIGDKIRALIFGVNGELNPSALATVSMFYVEELDELWIFIPTDNNARPTKFYRYRLTEDSFYERNLGFEVSGYGFNTSIASRRWIDLEGSWQDQDFRWVSQLLQANSPTTLLLDAAGEVYEYDYFEKKDLGVTIDYVLQTKDFRFVDRLGLFTEVYLVAKGSNILVEYSVNAGASWSVWGTITSATDYTLFRLHNKITCSQIRFRISGSGGSFAMESLGFRYRPTAPIR